MPALSLLLLLLACELMVPTEITAPPSDSGLSDPVGRDSDPPDDDTGDPGEDSGERDPFERDDDGDGFSENQGDCDDSDPAIHPERPDECNGLDDDCDGVLEEDARGDDIYEPNDDRWFSLGSLDEAGSLAITGILHNDDDQDRFSFTMDDPWYSSFGFEVRLSDIPEHAIYRLQLGKLTDDGGLEGLQTVYGGGELSLRAEGEAGVDDAGSYGVIIDAVGGADCGSAYLFTARAD
jgi:hypothetical protein